MSLNPSSDLALIGPLLSPLLGTIPTIFKSNSHDERKEQRQEESEKPPSESIEYSHLNRLLVAIIELQGRAVNRCSVQISGQTFRHALSRA
jgi:hypothetical protein